MLSKINLTEVPNNALVGLNRLESSSFFDNLLSWVPRAVLPNLWEVSLHSNPIRCDCIIRWVNMNRTSIRFMEPEALICAEPHEYRGQQVRQVHSRQMAEICPPLISPRSLLERVGVAKGSSMPHHCRACCFHRATASFLGQFLINTTCTLWEHWRSVVPPSRRWGSKPAPPTVSWEPI